MDASIIEKLPLIPMIVILVSVHEFAHAWMADRLGDDTPRYEGRVTLNPLAHIDWIGTVAVPAAMILLSPGFSMFGWGRPVRVNPYNFKHPAWGNALVAFAGPAMNLLMAFVALLLLHVIPTEFQGLAIIFAHANTFMAVFNLLPFPQFDGWRIVQPLFRLPEEIVYWGGGWGWTFLLLFLINSRPFLLALAWMSDLVYGLLKVAAGF